MACECAPIATAVGGIPEVLSRPSIGTLVRRGSDDAFDAAFIDAMRSFASATDAQLRSIGACARSHVDSHFNAAVQYSSLAELLEWHAGSAGPAKREQRAS